MSTLMTQDGRATSGFSLASAVAQPLSYKRSARQGRICSDNVTCFHIEKDVADQSCDLFNRLVGLVVKGATSQVAGSPAVLDQTVIVLDRTVIVLDRTVIVLYRTIIVLDRIVIVLDRSVTAIYGILSLNFLRPGGGSDRLWLLRTARHTSAPALPTLSCLSDDRYVNKTLPCAGLFPGARSCAFKASASRAPDLGSIPAFGWVFFLGRVIPVTYSLVIRWLPCQSPSIIGSALR